MLLGGPPELLPVIVLRVAQLQLQRVVAELRRRLRQIVDAAAQVDRPGRRNLLQRAGNTILKMLFHRKNSFVLPGKPVDFCGSR